MPNLDCVAKRTPRIRFRERAALHFIVVLACKLCRGASIGWKQLEKFPKSLLVPTKLDGNCQRIGPSVSRRQSTPEAKNFASGTFTSRSFFMYVMKWAPLTLKTKLSVYPDTTAHQRSAAGANRTSH